MHVCVLMLFMCVPFGIGTRVILVENAPTCFRRVLAGRWALRSFVRKVVPCERLEDCRRECALEKRFHCESFNYRLDQSFRGKGLCELMTKPIEAFDQHRDFVDDKNYDFYEIDRNSLEPNCPETLHGPGSLHSGFLSSKNDRIDQPSDLRPNRVDVRPNGVDLRPNRLDQRPNRVDQSGWRDRNDWVGGFRNSYDDRRFEDGRQGNRRYEEHFVPYQIGQARSEDDNSWGQYGGSYGGQYYKDSNDYHKSITHWGLNRPLNFRKSHEFDYHSLGKNLDIGLSRNDFHNIHVHKDSGYGYGSWKRGRWDSGSAGFDGTLEGRDGNEENRGSHECYATRKPGMSLKSGAIRRSLIAHNVVECETACFGEREFKCVSYSYRYSSSRGTDNCFLSERPYRGLDMSADTASDVYAMPQDKCVVASTKPWVESECFWHVRSDTSVNGAAVKATLTAAGLGACEAECIRAVGFFCRGFSYRFASPTDGDSHNCILTSSPTTTLSRSDASGHELYARGNYGRGCEPAVYDDTQNGECYLQYDKAARLTGAAIRGQARVKDEQTCGTACTEAPFRCLSFSYNNNARPTSDNCLLSEIRLFDLQRGVDYVHSEDDWLFAFDLFNSKCWRKLHSEVHTSELPHPIVPEDHGHFVPSGPGRPGYLPDPSDAYNPESGPSGPEGPIGPFGPSYEIDQPDKTYIQPFKPSRPERPSFRPEPEIYRPGLRPPESKNPNFQPPEIIIPYKPEYPDPEPRPIYRPEPRPIYSPESRPFRPEPSGYRPEVSGYRPEVSGYRPDLSGYRPESSGSRPERPFRPTEIYPKPDLGLKPGYLPGQRPQKPIYHGDRENGPMEASWRHYTVSGFPCRAGTKCAQNLIVGHWACEPEGGEIGSWDYCCAPTHRCGYSEGFHKPWCYVGHKQDQWRPCSEKYYPYHHHNTPHPSQSIRDPPRPNRPWRDTPNSPWPVKATPPPPDYTPHWDKPPGPYLSEADKNYWDRLYENGPKAYYDKYGNPLPGYSRVPTENRPYIRYKHNDGPSPSGHWVPVSDGPPPVPGLGAPRYWPVAYLHRGPPPNITYFRYNEKPTTERHYNTTNPRDGPESRDDDDDGLILDDDRSSDRSNGHSNGNNDYSRNNDDSRRNKDDSRRNNDNSRRNYDDSRRNYDDSRQNHDSRGNDDDYRRNNDDSRRNNDNSRRDNGSRRNDNNYRGNGDSYRGNDDSRRNYNNPRRNNDSRNDNDSYERNNPRNDNDSREDDDFRDNSRNIDSSRRNNDNSRNDSTRNETPKNGKRDEDTIRDDKKIDENKDDNIFNTNDKPSKTTTESPFAKDNNSDVELVKAGDFKTKDSLKGIDDKLDDFSKSIEVLNIEDAKIDKLSDLKTLEAEERQIEEIGRLLANRRGTQIVLEKRSQKDLEAKSIAIDKDIDFNFGNKFPIERRGVIKRISKDEIERDRNDKSLEVSETTFVRPPRVLSTTDNIRKAVVNGKIFYDATLKDRDIFSNYTRKPKNLRRIDNTTPSVINNNNFGKKKIIRTRNTNPVRRVKRVYRKRYNPEEVRRRLLERDRSKNSTGKA